MCSWTQVCRSAFVPEDDKEKINVFGIDNDIKKIEYLKKENLTYQI